jgi:hypothetical protein
MPCAAGNFISPPSSGVLRPAVMPLMQAMRPLSSSSIADARAIITPPASDVHGVKAFQLRFTAAPESDLPHWQKAQ